MKNSLEAFKGGLEQTEELISELEDEMMDITKSEEQKERKLNKNEQKERKLKKNEKMRHH